MYLPHGPMVLNPPTLNLPAGKFHWGLCIRSGQICVQLPLFLLTGSHAAPAPEKRKRHTNQFRHRLPFQHHEEYGSSGTGMTEASPIQPKKQLIE